MPTEPADPRSAPFRAVVFDMDGVLIDSEPFWREVERRVFGTLGLTLTDDDMRATMGLRIREVVAHWRSRHPWEGPEDDEVADEIVRGVIEAVGTRGVALPGVAGALAAVRRAGLRTALATSSDHVLIDAVLGRLGLREAFEVVHSAQDEARGKPDPAVYLTTARRLGVPPASCVAVEDSPNGVRAAKAAGMCCIAVPEPGADPAAFREADRLLPSLEALDEAVLDGLRRAGGGKPPAA